MGPVESDDLVEFGAFGGEHHDRQARAAGIVAQTTQHLEAVDAGQHDVEQHELGDFLGKGGKKLLGVAEAAGAIARLGERIDRQVSDVDVVLEVVDHRIRPFLVRSSLSMVAAASMATIGIGSGFA